MERIYLDTNILIPLVVEDKSLDKRRKTVVNALNVLGETEVEFCISGWTLTEMVKVMINDYEMQPKRVAIIQDSVITTCTVGGFKVAIVSPSPDATYSIEKLFHEVREIMTIYSPGWGDAIHCAIMRQNKLTTILSADVKHDFKIIPGMILLDPSTISIKPKLVIETT